ncbi:hypothetical protein PRIPAC_89335, partial [Pristionchus pacificus]|uniref:Uncharacterized protein n=1 Tax=Pristionchus pacificus TaxID=54126 RepID=A0A2A6CVA5_PRIPA
KLNPVFLLDGVAVGGSLGGVDQFVGQALSNRLDIFSIKDFKFTYLVEGGTPTDGTGAFNTGGVFTGARMDDLEGVLDDADSHELLSVVASAHHQRASKMLDLCPTKWALGVLLLDSYVVDKRDVPLSEELDLGKIALELKGVSNVHGLVNSINCPFVGLQKKRTVVGGALVRDMRNREND